MSSSIISTRINYPHSTAQPVRIMRADDILDVGVCGEVMTNIRQTDKDAFGRVRVSNPYTLFEFSSIYPFDTTLSGDLKFDISLTGSGSQGISHENSTNRLIVDSAGDRVIVQSREYILYQPGKSKLTYLTGVLQPSNGFEGNTIIGCIDGSNGYGFGYSNISGIYIVERSGGSDTIIQQDSWNVNTMKTGSTLLDFKKAQLFAFDQEWLGVGKVRLGFIIDGQFNSCHHFPHTNELTAPYMPSAKLPVRYDITCTGVSGELKMICGTVLSEGGYNSVGHIFGVSSPSNGIPLNSTLKPIVTLALKEDYPHINTTLKLKQIDIFNSSNQRDAMWSLIFNGTIITTASYVDQPYPSSARILDHSNGDTITGGTNILSGFTPANGSVDILVTIDDIIASQGVCRSIDGISDTLTLCARIVSSGTPTVYGMLNWVELK